MTSYIQKNYSKKFFNNDIFKSDEFFSRSIAIHVSATTIPNIITKAKRIIVNMLPIPKPIQRQEWIYLPNWLPLLYIV